MNPFLPLDHCIPDGEPHVFGDRVYLFGSHEFPGGEQFCCLPYEVYSAPVDNLKCWSKKGVSYTSDRDPHSAPGHTGMYAPDVVQGNDGRFYLYYCLDGYGGPISVALCDTPDGKYEYLGDVRNPDGSPFRRFVAFDPAVINDNGIIRLYYGTWYPFEDARTEENSAMFDALQQSMFCKSAQELAAEPDGVMGPVTVVLQDDMLTIASEPKRIMPSKVTGTCWEQHPFYEGASIRKIGGRYYFIYSSWQSHELCYAVSARPDEDFTYGGVIVSNGDIGYLGRTPQDRLNRTGNIHGSIACIGGQWYVFYHRQTHTTEYSRQACAEPITIAPDGSIAQVEMTSCGLNGSPLRDEGTYSAAFCCNLTNGRMPHSSDIREGRAGRFPYLKYENAEWFIHDAGDGTWIGYKYFAYRGARELEISCRGSAYGQIKIAAELHGKELAVLAVEPSEDWMNFRVAVPFPKGTAGLFLCCRCTGSMDIRSVTFR